MDQIVNKVKAQLFAKGVDNMTQLQDVFLVSYLSFMNFLKLPIRIQFGHLSSLSPVFEMRQREFQCLTEREEIRVILNFLS